MLGRHRFIKAGILSGSFYLGKCLKEEMVNRDRIEEIIEFLEIEVYRKKIVRMLPYGIQKRVELGRALSMDPKILYWMNLFWHEYRGNGGYGSFHFGYQRRNGHQHHDD